MSRRGTRTDLLCRRHRKDVCSRGTVAWQREPTRGTGQATSGSRGSSNWSPGMSPDGRTTTMVTGNRAPKSQRNPQVPLGPCCASQFCPRPATRVAPEGPRRRGLERACASPSAQDAGRRRLKASPRGRESRVAHSAAPLTVNLNVNRSAGGLTSSARLERRGAFMIIRNNQIQTTQVGAREY